MPYMISHITQYGRKKYLPLIILHYDGIGPYGGKITKYMRSLYPDKTRYKLLEKARKVESIHSMLQKALKQMERRLNNE